MWMAFVFITKEQNRTDFQGCLCDLRSCLYLNETSSLYPCALCSVLSDSQDFVCILSLTQPHSLLLIKAVMLQANIQAIITFPCANDFIILTIIVTPLIAI